MKPPANWHVARRAVRAAGSSDNVVKSLIARRSFYRSQIFRPRRPASSRENAQLQFCFHTYFPRQTRQSTTSPNSTTRERPQGVELEAMRELSEYVIQYDPRRATSHKVEKSTRSLTSILKPGKPPVTEPSLHAPIASGEASNVSGTVSSSPGLAAMMAVGLPRAINIIFYPCGPRHWSLSMPRTEISKRGLATPDGVIWVGPVPVAVNVPGINI